jgi:low affinity Fe/Cu permease
VYRIAAVILRIVRRWHHKARRLRMKNESSQDWTRILHDRFGRFAADACSWLGSTWAFMWAGLIVVAWVVSGPVFHFSTLWLDVINTGTNIATFLMVFIIQNAQNRDSRAINLKLNEVIRATDTAHNRLIDIEKLSDVELDEMRGQSATRQSPKSYRDRSCIYAK